MRLESLHLEAFGHFSGKSFDFGKLSEAQPDFHVIYGPNEAGKTTFMEAYLRLLYGFLPSEPYGFVHQRKNLRVSGVLHIDGASKTLVRLPSAKASLLDHNGSPVSESALQSSLGGLSMQDYRNLLCIDDETIEKGGEEIVNSQGDIGTLLFSAAAGISDLSTVLSAVREEADLLYRKNSSKTQLAQLKSQLKELDSSIAEQDVSAAQFKKLKAQLKAADAARDEVKEQSKTLYAEQSLLQRQLEALPLMLLIDELDNSLSPLAHFPEHLDIEQEQLMAMLPREAEAKAEIVRRNKELEKFRIELKSIELDEKQLAVADSLEQLQPLYAACSTARLGLEAERRKLIDTQQNMVMVARDFADEDIDPAQLVLAPSLINELDLCARSKTKAADELESAQVVLQKIESDIAQKKAIQESLGPADTDAQAVSEILEKFNGQVFLTEALAAMKRVDEVEREVCVALDKLTLKGQVFTSAPACLLHSKEAEELVREYENQRSDAERAVRELSNVAELIEHQKSEIAKVQSLSEVADDVQIGALKQARDAAWQAHRKDYLPNSADLFEASLLEHDKSMEGRVSNARTLSDLRQLHQRVAEEQANQMRLQGQAEQVLARTESIERKLADAVKEAGLSATISPVVAHTWIRDCEEAAAEERKRDRIKAELAPVLQKAERLHSALNQHIVREQATLHELMDAARNIDSSYRDQQKQIAEEQASLIRLLGDLKSQAEIVATLAQSKEQCDKAWRTLVSEVFPVSVDAEKLEPALNSLHSLRELDRDRVTAEQQVQSMESAIQQFGTEIEALSGQVGVALSENSIDTYQALKALSEETLVAHRRQTQLRDDIRAAEQALAQASVNLESIADLTNQFATHFGSAIPASNITELISAERTAREAIHTRKQRSDAEKKLLQMLELDTLKQARAQLAELNESALQLRLRAMETEIKLVDERYHASMEHCFSCKSELDAVVGDATVAELDQQRTTIELQMTEVALEHLRLSLGHKLAQKAILQYREKHRSSMMKATESVFVDLTNGAYSRLRSNTDGATETLQVVQASGATKRVHEPAKGKRGDAAKGARSDLSKGTRFQLYLALRAAAYEQLAGQGTCLPFICDDIFETFDEGRTQAACRVLQGIGRIGQAIYLTHHQHVVDIAKEVCGDNVNIHSFDSD